MAELQKEGETEICHQLVHSLNGLSSCSWAGLKPGASETPMLMPLTSHHYFPKHINRELVRKYRSQHSSWYPHGMQTSQATALPTVSQHWPQI